MQFGKILEPENEILKDLREFEGNPDKFSETNAFKLRYGLSKWGDKDWKGNFYPKSLSQKEFLRKYATIFSTVEINATYYQIFKPTIAETWKRDVAENEAFKFVLKVPAALSGLNETANYERILNDWLEFIDKLGNAFGICFIQYNGKFGEKAFKFIELVYKAWPVDIRPHIEIRHPTWFENALHFQKLYSTLKDSDLGLVITDTPGRQDVKHMAVSTDSCIIRYVGYDFTDADILRIKQWNLQIDNWKKRGLNDIYFLFHNPTPEKSLVMGKALV